MNNAPKLLTLFAFIVLSQLAFAQKTFLITGKVTNQESGAALSGVTIMVKGKDKGVTTDNAGSYKIQVPEKSTLVFSSVGFSAREFMIAGPRTLSVGLSPDAAAMGEVVVIGYGTVKKKDLTGAVSSVKSDEIVQTSPVSMEQALQGRRCAGNLQRRQPGCWFEHPHQGWFLC